MVAVVAAPLLVPFAVLVGTAAAAVGVPAPLPPPPPHAVGRIAAVIAAIEIPTGIRQYPLDIFALLFVEIQQAAPLAT
jgi:hypothetical protein